MLRLTTLLFLLFCAISSASAQELVITLLPTPDVCLSESIVVGPSEVTGGDGNYTYTWAETSALSATNIANPTFTGDGLIPVELSLTVADGSGLSTQVFIPITTLPLPSTDATVQQPSCGFVGGGFIFLINSGDVTYQWDDGSTGSSLGPIDAGIYCVTATSAQGCLASECYEIFSVEAPLFSIEGLSSSYCEPVEEISFPVTGGVPPYTYVTVDANGVVLSNEAVISNPPDGIYQTSVTDSGNCSTTIDYEVLSGIRADIGGLPVLDCSTGLAALNIGNSTAGPNVVYRWTRPNGAQLEASNITADAAGIYQLEVSDPTVPDCIATTEIEVWGSNVEGYEWITTRINECNSYVLQGITIPDYFGEFFYTWTLPDGSTQSALSILATLDGLYTLETHIPGLNCSNVSTVFVELNDNCGSITGVVRLDSSGNCLPEPTEVGVPDIIVTASSAGETFHAITDPSGNYSFYLPVGEYTITHTLPSSNWSNCQDSYATNVSEGITTELDLPLQAEGECPELNVTLSAPIMRRCFSNVYFIKVCNYGPETAIAPELTVILDDFLDYESAGLPTASINGQVLTFALEDLTPGACTAFYLNFTVNCDAELGQTHCTEAYATPDPLCPEGSDGWSGANLEITGECTGTETIFTLTNTGYGDLTETVGLIVIEDGIAMLNGGQNISALTVGETETISFPADGSTYTVTVDQAPGHPYSNSISSSVEGCGTNADGEFSMGFVTQYSQTTATPASVIYCEENTDSYDPNDKAAFPKGYGPEQYIEPETELNYRIRFQNTGTDTAFTVVVRDTLSEWLDVTRLRTGNSSHPYNLTISEGHILTFTFNNILLPDSTTNEPASNGYVFFRIAPKLNSPLETMIENEAAIYFDFNEPIFTNTVFHTLGRDFILVGIDDAVVPDLRWTSYPNPVSERLQLVLDGTLPPGSKTLIAYDAFGRPMGKYSMPNTRLEINMNDWPQGWYQLRLVDARGRLLGQERVVKVE